MQKRRSSAQGGGAQKKTKHEAADGSSNLRARNTIDITNQRDLGQPSETNSKHYEFKTYSRRFKKARQKEKKKSHSCSNWNLHENGFCSNSSSLVESAETGFRRKKNNDVSFKEGILALDRMPNGSVKERKQCDPTIMVSTPSYLNKMRIFGSEIHKRVKRRGRRRWWRRKKIKGTLTHANLKSVSKKEVSGTMKSEKESVEMIDLHQEIPSKSEFKKNIINCMLSEKEENRGLQRSGSVVAVNKNGQPVSPKNDLKTPVVKYTYTKRHNKDGQQGKNPHNYSCLNSQVSESGLCHKSLSIADAAEAGYERKENNNAPFTEKFLHGNEKGAGCLMKNVQAIPTNLTSPDPSSNIHEMKRIDPERTYKRARRRRNKKNKTPLCSILIPINEKDLNGSTKSEIIDSTERSDLYPEVCANSDMGNAKSESGRNGAMQETPIVSKDDALDNAQLCDVFPKVLEHKNEHLSQSKCEISVEQSDSKDVEQCQYSLITNVTDEVTSDVTIKEKIAADILMSLHGASISCGKKKLLVLDLNGLLVDVLYEHRAFRRAPIKVAGKSVYKRPFCDEFLEFCFERFDIGVWSSRKRKNIDAVVDFLFGEKRSQLLFCWDLSKCTTTGCNTIENVHKPLVLKELKKLWNKEDKDLPWEKGDYSPSNTLMIDDSPYKALCNPLHTAIFPSPYDHRDENDNALGLEGNLRIYLERIAMADNVQNYVKEHPFGQHAITSVDPSWHFYLRIIERVNASRTATGCS